MKPFFIVIHGPTGVGKTDFILSLGEKFPIEIINCDVGQMYEPIAIGTAKPEWQKEPIAHHLFDTITTPKNYSVTQYRNDVQGKIKEINLRNAIPVLVGGSGFYGKSLFFPPYQENQTTVSIEGTWDQLQELDSERAQSIHKNDIYRINRALSIIASLGVAASEVKPLYDPLGRDFLVIYLYKNRQVLYNQIDARTRQMIEQGWIEEVQRLQGTEWEQFLKQKKLIGYSEIFDYLEGSVDKEVLVRTIQKKTRNYAKRQETFWRMFKKTLDAQGLSDSIVECNLSEKKDIDLLCSIIQQRIFA
jgi:tRNA dimethylallyltransferase